MSTAQGTRIIYKPQGSRDEYFVYAYPEEVKKWRKDKSIPLTDVVQSFDIFEIFGGGNDGIAGRPSKQRLENTFGTSKNMDVLEIILEDGMIHNTGKETSGSFAAINETRGKGVATAENAMGIHN
ncbi:6208_t:CDS:2 [Paraglomus brasilianum]|uniref:6208_t:CDS:1 n=1 Tax=Paraglomus brasilianum TaxID=144538 RepID=A0A9N8WKX3_9GLOM|nr:6208_t:CDS:2 [Paraglomus brasilianum]